MKHNLLRRRLAAGVSAVFLLQNAAWAASCPVPAGGYNVGIDVTGADANYAPGVFTGTAGSIYVPDASDVNNGNGGHNWVFDQGSTLCRVNDTGSTWVIPPNTSQDCVVLPVIKGGVVRNLGDIPYQGDVITPTCNPALLSVKGTPNPANTRINQLGCALSHGVATDAQHATSYLFVAGIQGGLFRVTLSDTGDGTGKHNAGIDYYSAIPEGSKLNEATVSQDGQMAIVTSIRRQQFVYGCLNPLGDAGNPAQPIPANFAPPPAGQVACMQIGNNGLQTDLTTLFGPDNQPYFGGQRTMNTYNATPGGTAVSAYPQCIYQGDPNVPFPNAAANHNPTQINANLVFEFGKKSAGHCGNAFANSGFTSALITQPDTIAADANGYMYTASVGGPVVQFKVDTSAGFSQYKFRNYLNNPTGIVTGIGVATDTHGVKSLMVFQDPSGLGLAGQEVLVKLPLCEDIN